jgi:sterol desaturase/sphingolipid hydroxylase (fatty acid hydroxylase superfamily)
MWDFITTALSNQATALFEVTDQFNAYCLIGAALTAFLWFTLSRRGSFMRRTRAFLRAGSWRRVWLHKSTVLDFKLFFVTGLLNALGISGLFAISYASSAATFWLLGRVMTPSPHAAEASIAIAVVMGVLYWIVFDLGYWFAHFLMHRIPVLWEFHKVHHSAEVLTPLTEFRQHPVELFLFPLCTGTAVGVLFGAAEHLLGAERQGLTLVWINIVLFAYNMTLLHLRHSHVWIPLRGWLGYVLQSPAHHQIHHSTDPKHFNKNLGFGLSIWDWAFRTLYIPAKREALEFGLGDESHEHDGVLKVLWLPFVKAGRLLRRDLQVTPPVQAEAPQRAAPAS